MAKLSARGRTELARIKKDNTTHAIMSDWHILRKSSWLDHYTKKKENSGWTVAGKLSKKGSKDIREAVEKFVAKMEKGGYERVVK